MALRLRISVPSIALTYDKKALRATLRRAGAEVAAAARSKIKAAVGGGRIYNGPGGSATKYRGGYKPGKYQASSAGQAPVSVTGALVKSIKVRPFKSGDGVAVRDGQFYALFLEKGAQGGGRKSKNGSAIKGKSGIGTTRILAPRPFLTTALEDEEPTLSARIQAAVLQGIALKRQSP